MLKSINSWTGQPRDELAQMVAMLREQDQTECHMQRLAAQIGSWPVLPPATLDCKGVAEISLHIWSWRTAQERDWRSRSCWTASSRVLPTWSRRTLCQVVQQHPRQSPACHPDPPHSQQSQRSVKASARLRPVRRVLQAARLPHHLGASAHSRDCYTATGAPRAVPGPTSSLPLLDMRAGPCHARVCKESITFASF